MLKISDVLRAAASVLLLAAAACDRAPFPMPQSQQSDSAPEIDLSNYKLTFAEEFDDLDVSGTRCDTRWIAHTPYHGDFGAARFEDPSPGFPFVTRDGILRIEARKTPDAGWRAGLLSSWNTCDQGFAQQYGYFEISTKLPKGEGFWPAFWLLGINRDDFVPEIDVFEYHSLRPDKIEVTVHIHPFKEGVEGLREGYHHKVAKHALADEFNSYGVDVQEEEMIFYFNRKEIWRRPMRDEFREPLYILLNLAMDGGEITNKTPESDFMYVDYVRAYARQ